MVRSHDDERLVGDAEFLEALQSVLDRVVQFEQFSDRSLRIAVVQLLVDARSFRHHEPGHVVLLRALVQNVDRFKRHLLEAGRINVRLRERRVCRVVGAERRRVVQVVLVNVSIQPRRHRARRKESERAVLVADLVKSRIVRDKLVPLILPALDLRDVTVRGLGKEIGSASTEENVGSIPDN